MSVRLPVTNADFDAWGGLINNFLLVSHNSDGTIKTSVLDAFLTALYDADTILSGGSTGDPVKSAFMVNVQSRGATGDGVTDDRAAIQAALDTVNANGGGTVYIPRGTYVVSSPLSVYTSTVIMGAGWGSVLKNKGSHNGYTLAFVPQTGANTFLGCHGVRVTNLKVDGNCFSQTGGGCVDGYGAINCTIDHCHLTNPYERAGQFRELSDGTSFGHHNHVLFCKIDQGKNSPSNGQGWLITKNDENTIALNNIEFMGGSGGAEPYSIKDESGLNLIFGNSIVEGNQGVYLAFVTRTRIIGNVFDHCRGTGNIHINGSNRNIISDNHFYEIGWNATTNTCSGLYLTGNSSQNFGSNNVFYSVSASNQAAHGTTRSFIRENSVSNTASDNRFLNCNFWQSGTLGTGIVERAGSGTGNIYQGLGYVTRNKIAVTVTSAATSATFSHGLNMTPSVNDFNITATNNPTNDPGSAWISGITSTQATLNVRTAPGTSGATFLVTVDVY
jgi:hypothetical protein